MASAFLRLKDDDIISNLPGQVNANFAAKRDRAHLNTTLSGSKGNVL